VFLEILVSDLRIFPNPGSGSPKKLRVSVGTDRTQIGNQIFELFSSAGGHGSARRDPDLGY
jgi:hypothetical protein